MTCRPPFPAAPYSCGDLVPLGLLLAALHRAEPAVEEIVAARREVEQFLLARQQGQLWSFHTGLLVTATDSALILQGVTNAPAVEALEIFADGQGGYYPQLWQEAGQEPENGRQEGENTPRRMAADPANRHWRQPDYATTCLVRGLRRQAGLPEKTTLAYLAAGFERRSGLYFANPYLVDWSLGLALAGDAAAEELRQRLLAELLGSMNEDYSFGRYDVAMSTALAILSLAALGYRGRTMRLAQLRLLDFMADDGSWPEASPFYSTFIIDAGRLPAQVLFHLLINNNERRQLVQVEGQYHAISLYEDSHRLITTALAALALSEKCQSAGRDPSGIDRAKLACHPRYRCDSPSAYIAGLALLPYVQGVAETTNPKI